MKTIGVIGLGDMGLGMARNLLKHGFPVVAHDIRGERVRAIEEAVRLDDTNSAYAQLLEQYRALAPADGDPDTEFDIPYPTGEPRHLPRFERFDWAALGSELLAEGIVKVERVLTPEECDELIRLFTNDAAFEKRKIYTAL